MKSNSPKQRLMVDVRNSNEVKLVVDSATNGITWDHADWAEARFRNIAKFNTAKLEEVLTKAENINLNNYTQESIERLENAINVGKEALSSANQETIDKAIEKLKEAMDSLVEVNLNEIVQIKDEFLKASIQKNLEYQVK